jgi:hypothetical protein
MRHWDTEGWCALEPPTLTAEARRQLARAIRDLDVDGQRCGARLLQHDEYGGETDGELPCKDCPERLLAACTTQVDSVRGAYLAQVERILKTLDDAVMTDGIHLTHRLFKLVKTPRPTDLDSWPAAVLSIGLLGNLRKALRVRTREGLTLEFFLSPAPRWRTLYRGIPGNASHRASFLLDVLKRDPTNPLSAKMLVPRLWWEQTQA